MRYLIFLPIAVPHDVLQTVQLTTLDGFLPLHIAMKMQDRFGDPSSSVASSGGGNNQLDDDNKDNTSADGQSALEREAALKLNQNRYLSIVQELVTLYPEAVHLPAVDIIPVKEGVNPDTWEGQWRKSRWTPYSRALGKGKHTPIAKLLRPYKKKSDKERDLPSMMTPNRASGVGGGSGVVPGSSSGSGSVGGGGGRGGGGSKLETSSPPITPFVNHRTPIEVQLQNKLHQSHTNSTTPSAQNNSSAPTDSSLQSPTVPSPNASNNVHSANYGNMSDVSLPPLQSSPRGTPQGSHNTTSTLLQANEDVITSPRRSPRYNPGDSSMQGPPTSIRRQADLLGHGHSDGSLLGGGSGYTISSKQTLSNSQNADLFGSLSALRAPPQVTSRPTSSNRDRDVEENYGDEDTTFWAAKKVEVTESPTTFTIDNDASAKVWKWQW